MFEYSSFSSLGLQSIGLMGTNYIIKKYGCALGLYRMSYILEISNYHAGYQ